MARYYTDISKEEFLTKVKDLMDDEEFPYELPSIIQKDLSKVNFDLENITYFDDTEGFCDNKYPVGYYELSNNLHVFFINAGGDWEFPLCFIFYWGDGKLRAYIPEDGNVWNKKQKCAYGSEENDDDINYDILDKQINKSKIFDDIINRITKK